MVKRATSLFKSFGSNATKLVGRFCCPIYPSFRVLLLDRTTVSHRVTPCFWFATTWRGGHVGFPFRIIYIKMGFISQREKCFVLDHQHGARDVTCKPAIRPTASVWFRYIRLRARLGLCCSELHHGLFKELSLLSLANQHKFAQETGFKFVS